MKSHVITGYISTCIYVVMIIISSLYLVRMSPDYYEYSAYFNIINHTEFLNQRFEPVYYLMALISSQLFNVDLFIFISTLAAASAKMYAAYIISKKKLLFFVFAYLLLSFIIYDVISLRANLAVSFFMLAFVFYFIKRNILLFALFSFISIGCHYSILLLFLMFPVVYDARRLSIRFIILVSNALYFLSKLLVIIAIDLTINPLLEAYVLEEQLAGSIFSFYSIYLLLIFIVFSSLFNHATDHAKVIFSLALMTYVFASALIFVPVVYFRYLDVSILLLLYFIVSIEFSKSIKIRYWMCFLVFTSFCIFKILSLIVYSPILNYA